jgi:hypothetical protein
MPVTLRAAARRLLVLAALAGAVACHECNPTTPSLPSSPASSSPIAQSIAIGGTLSIHQPGDTGQLTATATFSDGTQKDVTSETIWTPWGTTMVRVSAGLVTAVEFGDIEIVATYGGARASMTARVAPEGAFLMTGMVTDSGSAFWVNEAKVEATLASGTYSATTRGYGYFALPAAGAVTLRASKDGYADAVQQVTVSHDAQVTLDLRQREQAGTINGVHALTFTASPSCTLPAEVMHRTYGALIEPGRAAGQLEVSLNGADFITGFGGDPGFTATVDRDTVRFAISDPTGNEYLTFVERIGDVNMVYTGTATGTIGDRKIVTTFDGRVLLKTAVGGVTVAECNASDHRLEFVR